MEKYKYALTTMGLFLLVQLQQFSIPYANKMLRIIGERLPTEEAHFAAGIAAGIIGNVWWLAIGAAIAYFIKSQPFRTAIVTSSLVAGGYAAFKFYKTDGNPMLTFFDSFAFFAYFVLMVCLATLAGIGLRTVLKNE